MPHEREGGPGLPSVLPHPWQAAVSPCPHQAHPDQTSLPTAPSIPGPEVGRQKRLSTQRALTGLQGTMPRHVWAPGTHWREEGHVERGCVRPTLVPVHTDRQTQTQTSRHTHRHIHLTHTRTHSTNHLALTPPSSQISLFPCRSLLRSPPLK